MRVETAEKAFSWIREQQGPVLGAASAMLAWRPRSNVSLYVSGEGMLMGDDSYTVVGKGGVRVGF
ncbi:MAG TPA: hypothetical protein VFL62_03400 [Bradyrhizobium sp.]|nr:hypothetical protein [Bradyrhizobium sp.]